METLYGSLTQHMTGMVNTWSDSGTGEERISLETCWQESDTVILESNIFVYNVLDHMICI